MKSTRFCLPHKIPEEYISKFTEAVQSTNLEKIPQQLMTFLKVYDQFKLDVAVTGDSGSGKSTLINALLGLDHDAQGAAPTGAVETTMEPAMYQYPNCHQVRLWDLPGMGTPSFMSKSYVETMNFNLYDMFFVVISERFRENNMVLIDEIHKQKKPFYVIRTKVDSDLRAQSRKHNFTETRALTLMRDECRKYVEDQNMHPYIFLVSAHDAQKYEMQSLKDTFEREASKVKREVFPLFLVNLFSEDERKQCLTLMHFALQTGKISEEKVLDLRAFCKSFDVANRTEMISTTLEALDHFQLDVAVIGQRGSGVTSFLKCLMTQQNGGAFCSVLAEMPAIIPLYPNVRFWALSEIEDNILEDFDFCVIIVTEWNKAQHIDVARIVQKLQKHYLFVQTKIDCFFQAQEDLCYSETEILEAYRAQCAEELQRANIENAQLFLINSLNINAFDFASLETILSSDLDTIRTSAFAYYIDRIVRNQKQTQSTCQIL